MSFLPLSYNPIETDKLAEILQRYSGQLHQKLITDFENELGKKVGGTNVVALNSGTAAIHMALRVLGVGQGDVVIAPSFTYVATINPILYQGAIPVFVDCEKETWNMSPDLLENALQNETKKGSRIKAILVMHNYGMPANMDRILQIAANYQLPVIEDAAEAIGSTYLGKNVGTLGRIGILSFNTNKVFTTYGGGALLTPDIEIARKVRFMASQARENLPYYEHREIGYNYIMGSLNAAYGLSQLLHLDGYVKNRRIIFDLYKTKLHQYRFQDELLGYYSNRWLPVALLPAEVKKELLADKLASFGFETRPLWRPMHLQPVFKDFPYYGDGLSERLFKQGICLPSGVTLTTFQQERVIEALM